MFGMTGPTTVLLLIGSNIFMTFARPGAATFFIFKA